MSYKNDHLLVISNKYGKASGDAKAQLFETYDQLRDLTAYGAYSNGSGGGAFAGWMTNLAQLIAPGSFMPTMGTTHMNIPGTSYYSPISGGNAIIPGGGSSFGVGSYGNYPGMPTGGASYITGSAAGLAGSGAGAAGFATGTASAYGYGSGLVLPAAGVIAGIGGIAQAMSPYFPNDKGLGLALFGNITQSFGGATLAAISKAKGNITNNADIILTNKVKNIETVVKMLDAQSDVIKKMLKNSVEGASKMAQDL